MSASIYALKPFTPIIVTGNLTYLMSYGTPSPKQNVLLDLAVFTKYLSRLFNVSKKISNLSFLASVREPAEFNTAIPSVSLTSLDIFIFKSFILFL